MKATFVVNNVPYPMIEVSPEVLDDILSNPKTKAVVGFPLYFDTSRRIWPNKTPEAEVIFDE